MPMPQVTSSGTVVQVGTNRVPGREGTTMQTSTTAEPVVEDSGTTTIDGTHPAAAWRLAGGLGIAHVVLIFGGLALQAHVRFEDGRSGIAAYGEGSLPTSVAGGYLELLGFLLLLPVMVFLARAIGRTPGGRWAAQSALAAGIGYVAITFSPGLAAGATAMHAVHDGSDLDAAWTMNNLRVITYVVSLVLLAGHAIGVAIAARADGFSPRLVGAGGLVAGAALLAAPLLLGVGLHDLSTLVWTVWWLALSVQLLRRVGR
jgi:hypothetical protein